MATATRPFGASFLIRSTPASEVVTPEDLGEEERLLMQSFEEFAEREVAPHLEALEAGADEVGMTLFRKAAELGLFMAEVPEEYGGLDLNVLAVTAMCSIRSKLGSLGSLIYGHQGIGMLPLINFATAEQRERYLEPCMSGDMLSAFALTEPSTGSDAMNITTRAELSEDGTHYVVNGGKQWITNANFADIFILFAKVDGEHFTAFVMERDSEGLSIGANERLLGLHGSSVAALALENVRIPVDNVLGEVGKGHLVAFCTLNVGRLKLATNASSGARAAVRVAATYAAERVQFGRPIGDFGLIQRKLADMASRAYAAEAVAWRTAGLVYREMESDAMGERPSLDAKLAALSEFSIECAMAKVFTSEAYHGLTDEALQVFGGYGFSEEYPPAKMYRDSRITRIYEGTNEICRLYAQRAILKRAGKGSLDLGGDGEVTEAPVDGDAVVAGGLRTVSALKAIYAQLVRAVVESVPAEGLFEPEHQQYLASLADVATEIFAAESVLLRVHKGSAGEQPPEHLEDIVILCVARAMDRVQREATEVLTSVHDGAELQEALRAVSDRLPLRTGLIQVRGRLARAVVAAGGVPTAA